jgi:NAD+ synthase (glutamine-hydrolysing)
MTTIRIAGAQIDLTVGDLSGNEERILEAMVWAERAEADVLVVPELAVVGYPPEDLVLREGFVRENLQVLHRLAEASGRCATVVGFVDPLEEGVIDDDSVERRIANAAAVIARGRVVGIYHKELLPNYGVFDEARYFAESREPTKLWEVCDVAAGVSICEDIWSPDGPPARQAAAGATLLLNINGSPFHERKGDERAVLLSAVAKRSGAAVAYVNCVGGQDELVFDGDSMVFDAAGELVYRAPQFTEELFVVDLDVPADRDRTVSAVPVVEPTVSRVSLPLPASVDRLADDAAIYQALVTGLRDYVTKNGFGEVIIGLSGGIDSALATTLAVDALGPAAVHTLTMPSRYSSRGSVADSEALAANLGCRFSVVPIEGTFESFLGTLDPLFEGTPSGVAEENLQARIRGTILMAVSNKFGGMVVATGNKSEMAVGYATLYGDMAGGYAVLKDVYKTLVYRLAGWRNRDGEVIPQAVIDKAPSAELRPDQLDTDSLPPYDVLDAVLEEYIERDRTVDEIAALGYNRDLVCRVARMVDRNEYKRRQAPPGVKITRKGFGRDRRLPITNRYLNQ